MHGTKYANYAIQNSDLLMAIGARFDDRVTGKISSFAPHARIVLPISIDQAVEERASGHTGGGDARNALQGLLKRSRPNLKAPGWERSMAGRRIIPHHAIFRT